MRSSKYISLTFFSSLFISSIAAAVPLDLSSDTISDPTNIRITSTNTLAWSYFDSKKSLKKSLKPLGIPGNHIALGEWKRGEPTLQGVIAANSDLSATWTIQTKTALTEFKFGTTSDLFIAGADFDANGVTDATVVSITNGALSWSLIYNPLETDTSAGTFLFGKDGDLPFFMRTSVGKDYPALVRQNPDGTVTLLTFDIPTSTEASVNLSQIPSSFERPTPIRLADGTDNLIFRSKSTNSFTLEIFSPTGVFVKSISIPTTGDFVVGDFVSKNPGFEVGYTRKNQFIALNPTNGKSKSFAFKTNIIVDEININSFSTFGTPGATCSVGDETDGFKRGFIWKPNSDTQFYGVVILPFEFTQKTASVEAQTTSGTTINALKSKGCANPDDQGPRCNWMATPYTGSTYKEKFGSIRIKVTKDDGSCTYFNLDNPAKRID